jgi:glycosyltransferase involved in cell wall biosynthesis
LLYVCLDPGIPVGSAKGAAVHVGEMLRALGQEGHQTALVARRVSRAPDGTPTTVVRTPARLRRVPMLRGLAGRLDTRRVEASMAEAIATLAPDVVYERYSLGQVAGAAAARVNGLPLILEVNAPLARERAMLNGQSPSPAAVAVERATWLGADAVVVPSRELAEMVRRAGQPTVLTLPNAVDPELFNAAPTPTMRTELGLADRLVVGFAGTVRPWHDLGTVVDAVAALPADLPASLLVVGDRPPPAISERASALGVDLVVTGQVPHEQVPAYLSAVDIAVASLSPDPALSYFSPLKALEYLASGRPTVVADVGDLIQLAEQGVAVPYRAGDAGSLGAVVRALGLDPRWRARLGAEGRAYAQTRTWRAVAAAVVAAAEDLRDHAQVSAVDRATSP